MVGKERSSELLRHPVTWQNFETVTISRKTQGWMLSKFMFRFPGFQYKLYMHPYASKVGQENIARTNTPESCGRFNLV
jgi:hypothetical protein